jgi:hypothetical protein
VQAENLDPTPSQVWSTLGASQPPVVQVNQADSIVTPQGRAGQAGGLDVGEVRFLAVAGFARIQFAGDSLNSCESSYEYRGLCRSSRPTPLSRINADVAGGQQTTEGMWPFCLIRKKCLFLGKQQISWPPNYLKTVPRWPFVNYFSNVTVWNAGRRSPIRDIDTRESPAILTGFFSQTFRPGLYSSTA